MWRVPEHGGGCASPFALLMLTLGLLVVLMAYGALLGMFLTLASAVLAAPSGEAWSAGGALLLFSATIAEIISVTGQRWCTVGLGDAAGVWWADHLGLAVLTGCIGQALWGS